MSKKSIILALIIIILLPSISSTILGENRGWWDDEWSYRQEIIVPIDTSLKESKYQPIDTRIKFEKSCWAKDEKHHSVRVVLHQENNLIELESQIYNLEYIDEEHISKCSLVFLIPSEATGCEKYFVYYDDEEKSSPEYTDHVQIEEAYYRYELMPGYSYESYYYKISEDGSIVYTVAQKGKILGIGTSQQVMKFKPKTKKLLPCNGETIAFFDFWYYYNDGFDDYKSTCQKLISKDIFADGNLMVGCTVISRSNEEDMETVGNYKYYYCPKGEKKIYAHLEHEVLKEGLIKTYDFYDGSYASLQTGGIRSNKFKELNLGEIYPYIHIHSEDNIVKEFSLYTDPEYSHGEWNIPILTTLDDVDLGDQSWACYDKGNDGMAHSLILGSNSVVKSGKDEKDGVQVQIYETGYPDLPGLENNVASFQLGRNSYEHGLGHDQYIPKGFKVGLDVDFFSTKTGGYKSIARESSIFKELVKIMPEYIERYPPQQEEERLFSLKTNVFFASSFPLGSILSTLTKQNFSYITGEIYKDGNLIQSNIASRLSLNPFPDIKNKNLLDKIKLIIGIFDFKNFTIFKKIIFRNLQPGDYLIKIYRNNPVLNGEKKYIGYQFINLTQNTTSNIFCTNEGKIKLSIINQNKDRIENIKILLLDDDNIIAETKSDGDSKVVISAPCKIKEKYHIKMIYDGFLIHEEQIKLGLSSIFSPVKITKTVQLYNYEIRIIDTWGLPICVTLSPYITSENMVKETNLFGETNPEGVFKFEDLIPETYTLNIKYKSEELQETIEIPDQEEKTVVLPLDYKIKTRVFNTRGIQIKNIKLEFIRENKKKTFNVDKERFLAINLPPGEYTTKIYNQNNLIGQREITILGERSVNLVTKLEPIYPLAITLSSLIFVTAALYLLIKKKDISFFLKIVIILILVMSIVYPWWSQNGSTSEIQTSTHLYIKPVEMVTLTSSPTVISGSLASLPGIFIDVINSAFIFIVISCIIIGSTFITDKYQKTKISKILTFASFILLLISLVIFLVSMSEFVKLTVGNLMGKGVVETSIIGQEQTKMITSSWGLDIGFFVYLSAVFLLFLYILLKVKKNRKVVSNFFYNKQQKD